MLDFVIAKRAKKFIENLPAKQANQILATIQALRANPEPQDSRMLKGHEPLRRATAGEYRIIYEVRDSVLLIIVLVGRRNDDDVYKQLRRL